MDITNYQQMIIADNNYRKRFTHEEDISGIIEALKGTNEHSFIVHTPKEFREDKLLVETGIYPGEPKFYLLDEDNFLHSKYALVEGAPAEINPFIPDSREWSPFQWFCLFVQTGKERQAIKNLYQVLEYEDNLKHKVGHIICSIEKQIRIPGGYREIPTYPNYLFAQLSPDPSIWSFVKRQKHIAGFVGKQGDNPKPLSNEDVEKFHVMEIVNANSLPKIVYQYEEMMAVKIEEGPFVDCEGVIAWTNQDEGKCGIAIQLFNRLTTVEVEFSQIKRL